MYAISMFRYMVATQFEISDARAVFPCVDEPSVKAIFHLTLIYPTAYVALGNMMEKIPIDLQFVV